MITALHIAAAVNIAAGALWLAHDPSIALACGLTAALCFFAATIHQPEE